MHRLTDGFSLKNRTRNKEAFVVPRAHMKIIIVCYVIAKKCQDFLVPDIEKCKLYLVHILSDEI